MAEGGPKFFAHWAGPVGWVSLQRKPIGILCVRQRLKDGFDSLAADHVEQAQGRAGRALGAAFP